jgi:hypothetical protein
MSDHTKAIVPIETWWYSSPELHERDVKVDMGLFAEALVYYDQLYVKIGNAQQLASFIEWFIKRGQHKILFSLINEDVIHFYHYAFLVIPFLYPGGLTLYHIDDPSMKEPNSFQRRILDSPEVVTAFSNLKLHAEFCKAMEGKIIEEKVEDFENTIHNANADYTNQPRNRLLLQSFLDEMYLIKGLGEAPSVQSKVINTTDGRAIINWGLDMDGIAMQLGIRGVEGRTAAGQVLASVPLTCAGMSNDLLLSAMHHDVDLYLPSPLSIITGDKLYESSLEPMAKTQVVINELQNEVEFPDLRWEVNENNVDIETVIRIRKKAERFRKWLQGEAEKDRNAIIAYHNEAAKDLGFTRSTRKILRMFGVFGGPAGGAAAGALLTPDPVYGAVAGTLIGEGVKYLFEVGAKIGISWTPIVFGKWYKERISRINEAREAADNVMNPLGTNRARRRSKTREERKRRRKLPKKNKGK